MAPYFHAHELQGYNREQRDLIRRVADYAEELADLAR